MSTINIKNLTFSYDGSHDNIFENVNLQINTDWKLGLVGRNGKGKTTLLKQTGTGVFVKMSCRRQTSQKGCLTYEMRNFWLGHLP